MKQKFSSESGCSIMAADDPAARAAPPLALSSATLGALPRGVGVPRYARALLRPGIVHIGVGNFHRAHQAVYLDDRFDAGADLDWAIVGAGVRDADRAMRRDLAAQDFLTTVVARETDHEAARVIGAMVDFIEPGDATAVIETLADSAIRIVSLTITEGGYCIDPASQRFDAGHADIVADAGAIERPIGAFGLIVAGLIRRRNDGVAPYTVLSCDNVPGNGRVARDAVTGLARLVDTGLARWIEDRVAFPSSMVDRITPVTTAHDREALEAAYGIRDARPVFCEEYRQWVIEDRFPAGRPALEEAGVQFVADVAPFEHMKIRILNGAHAALAYPAALLGIRFVHEALEDPLVRGFVTKLLDDEIVPEVPPVPGTNRHDYRSTVLRRFANPRIGDTVRRVCFDGSNRQPKFVLPTAAERVRSGRSVDGLALASALWCRYCHGTTDAGIAIEPNDPEWPKLVSRAHEARRDPRAWLAMRDIFGELGDDDRYVAAFARALGALWQDGTRATLARYIGAAAKGPPINARDRA
jgi:mannitol 2-dehydrogenase